MRFSVTLSNRLVSSPCAVVAQDFGFVKLFTHSYKHLNFSPGIPQTWKES